MSAAPRVFLVFGGAWLEVDASLAERRGGLRALSREAESKWNLQPNLHEFRHTSGKVDSPVALQRAFDGARNGVCKLDIIEHPEGKMMRTMQTEMKLLEDRIMAKVESMFMDAREEANCSTARLSGSIAPMLQCLATEQIELRNKLSGMLAPMVQCLATEQIELRNTVGQLRTEVSDLLEEKASVVETTGIASSLKNLDDLELELQQECAMQSACDLDLASTVNVDELKDEVCQLSQKHFSHHADCTKSTNNAAWSTHSAAPTIDFKQSFTYSSKAGHGLFEAKWNPGDSWSYGNEISAPFAQSTLARQMRFSKSTFGHQSCPLLPPLVQ